MWFRPVTAVVVMGLATSIAAGCGGDGESRDADQIRSVWTSFASALASDDGAAACRAMTPRFAHSIESIAHARARTPALAHASCAKIMSAAFRPKAAASVFEPLLKGTVRDIEISNGVAKFNVHGTFENQGVNTPGGAKRLAGAWRISCCLGPGIPG